MRILQQVLYSFKMYISRATKTFKRVNEVKNLNALNVTPFYKNCSP